MRVEPDYDRGGAPAYLAALDVHRGKVYGRFEGPGSGPRPVGSESGPAGRTGGASESEPGESGDHGFATVQVKLLLPVFFPLVAVTRAMPVPAPAGEPEINPVVALIDSPAGRLDAVKVSTSDAFGPAAVMGWETALPRVSCCAPG